MTYAETLSEKERKRARIYTYFACLTGCVAEVMLDSSAIIILFFTMINGGDTLIMLGNSFSGISGALLYIPFAYIITRVGLKKIVHISCIAGCIGYLLIGISPWFGMGAAKYIALTGCLIYCLQRSSYGAAWYPMLDVFICPAERGRFFGTMRFIYTSFTGILFFIIGLLLRYDPPIIFLQLVIIGAGLLILGRDFCLSRLPDNKRDVPEPANIKKGLKTAMLNGPLTSYSLYLGVLSMAYTSLLPLIYLYLKQYVDMNPGSVQIISSMALAGLVTGYFCYGRFLAKLPLRYLELLSHGLFIFSAFAMFFMDKSLPFFPAAVGFTVFCTALGSSIFMCNNSAELLALARPGNKTMATAFIQTYNNVGTALGRGIVSLVLGTGMLAPEWVLDGRTICHYQTIFLFSGLMLVIILLMLPTLPSFIPAHEDYYDMKK
jgi:MFS family permease